MNINSNLQDSAKATATEITVDVFEVKNWSAVELYSNHEVSESDKPITTKRKNFGIR